MEKNKVVVQVHELEYTIVGGESPAYIRRVAAYVDSRMTEIAGMGNLGEQRLTMLTALNIADELLKAKDDIQQLRTELKDAQATVKNLQNKAQNQHHK